MKTKQLIALSETVADGLRQVTIGRKGAQHPAVVAVALVEGK